MYAWGGGGWELDLGPQSMWYILVWPGLQAIPFETHTSVTYWVRVCVTGEGGVGEVR